MTKLFSHIACLTCLITTAGYAQETVTAPPEHLRKSKPAKKEESKPAITTPVDETAEVDIPTLSLTLPKLEVMSVGRGNANNLLPGFYATFAPPTPDTIEVFEGGTDQKEVINIGGGKEIVNGDSVGVIKDLNVRYKEIRTSTRSRTTKSYSTTTRTGFIPGQGFGTNRFRFGVRPGNFTLRQGAMITASVHMKKQEDNIGNILCAITGIDYANNVFYVEASNEVPKGENINWIIINYPEVFSSR
jgi:hypothetical protein